MILTHEHADFDAVASLVGLSKLRPRAVPILPQVVNENVRDFLTLYGRALPLVERDGHMGRIRRVWLVDTSRAQLVRGVKPKTPRSIIDHHVDEPIPQMDGPVEADVQAVGSTATLLVERLINAATELSAVEATLMLLGIYEDTGRLTYPGTTSRDLHAAAWLLDQGADLQIAAEFLDETLDPESRALLEAASDNAEHLEFSGQDVAIAAVSADGFSGELAPVATRLGGVTGSDAWFLVADLGSFVQVVARSRTSAVDVGGVAEALGGGGHRRAAAAHRDSADAETVVREIKAALPDHVQPAHRVREIMARGGVRTIPADADVRTAHELAGRHGHEGFPVVTEDDRVAGLVTRQDLDRAIRHGLGDLPVEQIMTTDPPTVSSETAVEVLQELMLEHRLGQIPVVDAGQLTGIVTRTDLLKLWAEGTDRHPAPPVLDLSAAFVGAVWSGIRAVAEVAHDEGMGAYLVGGVPRDMLLGIQPGIDVDIVVEGDAIQLARRLAKERGGRAKTHRRFGTAKWLRGESEPIDLVTARAEFYPAPTALPGVERGSLKSDLRRRDFTINTLAVNLSTEPRAFGRVIDLFGGQRDLDQRVIRVLHSLSFVEDPTRILRAVRFASRLGFDIEDRTAELMERAVPLLKRVSGARLRNELQQLFQEPDPGRALAELHRLGALAAIHSGVQSIGRPGDSQESGPAASDGAWATRFAEGLPAVWSAWRARRPDLQLEPAPPATAGLVAWIARQGSQTTPGLAERLDLPNRDAQAADILAQLWEPGTITQLAELNDDPVAIYRRLSGIPRRWLVIGWYGAPDDRVHSVQVGSVVAHFLGTLDLREPSLAGDDILAMGLEPGPAVGEVLEALHQAKLRGHVASEADERALARELIAARLGDAEGRG